MAAPDSLSREQVRSAVLAAQGFDASSGAAPGTRRLMSTIRRLGLLQVDSVSVLARAHYIPLFSRLGPYDRDALDRQSGHNPRRLFEYWGHEASLLPVETQPLLRWRMAEGHSWSGPRKVAADRPDLVAAVRETIAAIGPATTAQVETALAGAHTRSQDYHWGWNWSDAKRALEHLFWVGEISSAGRDRSFARRYDLTERVLPTAVLAAATPSRTDSIRALVEQASRAMAVATEADLRDYWRLPRADTRAALGELLEEGILAPVAVPGWPAALIHRDAVVPRSTRGEALLVAFDPLTWNRDRVERVFGMRYRIEIYVPASKREFGYYVLPYLYGGQLVARVDLKADRQAGVLRVRGAWSQRAVTADPQQPAPSDFAEALDRHLRRLATWLGLHAVAIDRRGDLADSLRGQLPPSERRAAP